MWCRKLVLLMYVLHTALSSLPSRCYAMEHLDEKTYLTQKKKPTLHKKGNKNTKQPESSDSSYISIDLHSLSSNVQVKDPEYDYDEGGYTEDLEDLRDLELSPREVSSDVATLDTKATLESELNTCIYHEIPKLFPEYHEQFHDNFEVKTGLINFNKVTTRNKPTPFTWDEGDRFWKHLDDTFVRRIPSTSAPRSWPEEGVRAFGSVVCGAALFLYAMSSFGLDPTRLYLMGKAFPFLPIQGDVSIGLSLGFAIYHVPIYAREGWNRVYNFYQRFLKNRGMADTHGFMTVANDQCQAEYYVESLHKEAWEETKAIQTAKTESLKQAHITDIGWENKDYLRQTFKYSLIGFVASMYALLYSLIFFNAEEENDQALYARVFVGGVFTFIFGTMLEEGCKQWDWSSHNKLNKEESKLNDKKKALLQTLSKTQELINVSDTFVETVYPTYTAKENTEFLKFSLLFLQFSLLDDPSNVWERSHKFDALVVTTPPDSLFRSMAKKVGKFGVAAWAIPSFYIFSSIGQKVLGGFFQLGEEAAYWGSVPIGAIVSGFGIWSHQPKIYANIFDQLSPLRPLYGLNWGLSLLAVASAVWSTFAYVGVLSETELLGGTPPLVKYALYSTSLFSVPSFLHWEMKRWNEWICAINSLTMRSFKTTTQKRIFLNEEIERAKEFIFKADKETIEKFTYKLWGIV